jgi:nucleoside-diphosphate-sugar epimerase
LASLNISRHRAEDIGALVQGNILLPALILETLAETGGGRFVNMGSAWQHFSGPQYDPVCLYAATKQSCEAFLTYYAAAHRIPSISLKLFHAYGPGDSRLRLLNLLCRAALSGERVGMSEGHQIVDYVHVDDVVEAVLCADRRMQQHKDQIAESFAIPSGRSITVRQLVSLVERISGRRLNVVWGDLPNKPREIMSEMSCGRSLPGWTPVVSLEAGIRGLLEYTRRTLV